MKKKTLTEYAYIAFKGYNSYSEFTLAEWLEAAAIIRTNRANAIKACGLTKDKMIMK
jgi:hypothetical protein